MKSNRLKRSKTSRHFRNLYLLCGTNANRLRIKNKCSIVEREEEEKNTRINDFFEIGCDHKFDTAWFDDFKRTMANIWKEEKNSTKHQK